MWRYNSNSPDRLRDARFVLRPARLNRGNHTAAKSTAVPEIVIGEPVVTALPEEGEVMVEVGGLKSVDAVAALARSAASPVDFPCPLED